MKIVVTLFLFTSLLNSCIIQNYTPNSTNPLVYEKKFEPKVSLSYRNYQVSSSISNHWAFAYNKFNKVISASIRSKSERQAFDEIGIGYFSEFKKSHHLWSIFLLGGLGKSYFWKEEVWNTYQRYSSYNTYADYTFESKLNMLSIQGNLGVKYKKSLVVYSLKVSDCYFYNIRNEIDYHNYNPNSNVIIVSPFPGYVAFQDKKSKNSVFIQPSISIITPNKPFSFQIQTGFCYELFTPSFEYFYSIYRISFALQINIGMFF